MLFWNFGLAPSALGDIEYVWDGGGGDNLFGNATNWNPNGAPVAGTDRNLHFAGNVRPTPNNNFSDWSDFKNILFDSGASSFTVSGNPIDLFGKIENNSTVLQTVSLSQFSFNNSSAELDPTLGDLTINASNIFTNGNTISVWGNSGKTLTINNTGGAGISQGGGLTIRQNSNVVLTGSNAYTGATTISGGKLQLGNGGTTGSLSTSSTITNNANFTINRSNAVAQGTDFSGSAITGTGSLTQAGGGTTTLTAANTYSGGTSVNAGIVEMKNSSALGSGTVNVASGKQVWFNADSLTVANNFTLNGITTGGALVGGDRATNNVTNLTGTITLAATSNVASWWNDKTLQLSGKITGAGGLTFDRATSLGGGDPNGGKFLVSGSTNDYAGNTTLNGKSTSQSELNLGANNALPSTTALTLNSGRLVLNGFSQTVTGLTSTGTSDAVVGNSATQSALTINSSTSVAFGGVLGGTGTNSNNLTLTKGGAGSLTLSGVNTYTGATAVQLGKLVVSGFIGNSVVTVTGTNTTLASGTTGTIGSSVTINTGAILAPGDAGIAGTATVGSTATFNDGSIFSWDISSNGASYDKLISGAGLVDGNTPGDTVFRIVAANSSFSDTFWSVSQNWTDIFTTNGTNAVPNWSDIFTNVTVVGSDFSPITPVGGSFSVTGNILAWTVVPEPSTSVMTSFLLGSALFRRSRRKSPNEDGGL